jgi:hypothetical protein
MIHAASKNFSPHAVREEEHLKHKQLSSPNKSIPLVSKWCYCCGRFGSGTTARIIMRIQLELPEAKVQELKALMEETGVETYKDLFNNALTLLEWAIEEVEDGRVLASVDEQNDKYRVLVMPILERMAKRAKNKQQPVSA